jgi:dUTP pyrophosphatase
VYPPGKQVNLINTCHRICHLQRKFFDLFLWLEYSFNRIPTEKQIYFMIIMKIPEINVAVLFFDRAEELYPEAGTGIGPRAATSGAAGFDLCAALPEDAPSCIIEPYARALVHTGIAIQVKTPGVSGFVYSRSGLGAVQGLTVAQGVGVIDPDYRGEIMVYLLNTGKDAKSVRRGDRIAQLVFQPFFHPVFARTDKLDDSERGGGGFGHTGC